MRKEKTLRQKLPPFLFAAIGIPILIFACISQYRLQKSMSDNMDMQIESGLEKALQCMDMELSKYDTLLYDFCTDDEVLKLVEDIDQGQGDADANGSELTKRLRHICGRNSGIAGITVLTSGDKQIYYDSLSDSSADSVWAADVRAPESMQEPAYEGSTEPIVNGKDPVYTVRITRKLTDSEGIHKDIGTVVMSIDEDVLEKALLSRDVSEYYLCQNTVVIGAPDKTDIGKKLADIQTDEYRYTCAENETSGFTVCNKRSMEAYHRTLIEQGVFWILIAVAAFAAMFVSSILLTRPYIKEVDEHMEHLIEQAQTAALEQKNAELSALEAQIDPHFLYNTLDTINWKAIEKGEFEISELVGALADILRYSVMNPGEETSVEQEIYWLYQYILLQSAKVENELQVEIDVPEVLKGCRIHKLLLQPFVENAIKHGIKGKEGTGKLRIAMKRAGGQIHITVRDNGTGMDEGMLRRLNAVDKTPDPENAALHMGIKNVRRRLKLYYEDGADIYFESKEGEYTTVHIFIPVVFPGEGGDDR